MKFRPRRKRSAPSVAVTLCQTGLALRHEWAEQVQNATLMTYSHIMFGRRPLDVHATSCPTCGAYIKARQEKYATN